MGMDISDNLFCPRKEIYSYLGKYIKDIILQTNESIRRRHFLLNCRRATWIIVCNVK